MSTGIFYSSQGVDTPGVQITPGVFQLPQAKFDTDYWRYQFGWKHTVQLLQDWSVTGSAQVMHEDGRREGFQKLTQLGLPTNLRSSFAMSRVTPALVAEMDAGLFRHIRTTIGFRLDFPEDGGPQFSPKLGILYRPDSDTALRFNVGRGFKLPSFNALGDPLIGNEDLKPEKSIGTDLGIERTFFSGRHSVALTYFYNRFSALIDLDPDLARAGVFKLMNLNTVETQGIELTLKLHPWDSINAKGYFNYLYSDIKGTDESLRNRPRFSGGVVFDTTFLDEFVLRADVNLVGKKYDIQIPTRKNQTEAYGKINLSLTYAPTKAWRLYAVVDNLTNTKYEDYIGFPHPGTTFRLGFAIRQ